MDRACKVRTSYIRPLGLCMSLPSQPWSFSQIQEMHSLLVVVMWTWSSHFRDTLRIHTGHTTASFMTSRTEDIRSKYKPLQSYLRHRGGTVVKVLCYKSEGRWAGWLSRCSNWLRAGRSGIEWRWGRDFPPVQTGPGAHPASCKMGTGSFPGVKCGRGMLLNPLLVPLPWKSRAIPVPTLWATPGL